MPNAVHQSLPVVEPEYLPIARRIAALAADKKAANIVGFDLQGLTVVADGFVLCTANSEPQMKAIYTSIREGMREAGSNARNTEGTFQGGWLLLDFGDIIVHVFREEAREFYDLEGLWGDAPRLDLALDTAA